VVAASMLEVSVGATTIAADAALESIGTPEESTKEVVCPIGLPKASTAVRSICDSCIGLACPLFQRTCNPARPAETVTPFQRVSNYPGTDKPMMPPPTPPNPA